jgi:hypothetical protein
MPAPLGWYRRSGQEDAVSGNFAIQNANVQRHDVLKKSDPKPFIHHLAKDKANTINTFL